MTQDFRLMYDGQLVAGSRTIPVINPATGTPFADCPVASEAQLDEAVGAAVAAQRRWARTTQDERSALLHRLAEAVDQNSDALARLLTLEQGKPLGDSVWEVGFLAQTIRHFAGLRLPMEVSEDSPARRVELHYKPLGVVAGIIPWNFPLGLVGNKLPAALMAGNAIVIKPAPTTPLSTLMLGQIFAQIAPAGLISVLTDANDLGSAITAHPGIAKVSFTGSTATGIKVIQSAGPKLKRVTLELGGNDAAIVLGDVDPHTAAAGIFGSAFANAGQVCVAVKRAYVHDSIYDAVVDELTAMADAAVVGDGLEQGTQYGPIQNRMQYDKARGFLDSARKDGVITTREALDDRPGYFIRPTVVRDIHDGARLVDEEQFAPILPVIRYNDPEEALALANASSLGLGGSVWSADAARAHDLACRMEAGTVWVNKHLDLGPSIPLPTAKQSGLGVEMGLEGLKSMAQLAVVNIKV